MIEYIISPETQERFELLKDAILLNVFLPKAGILFDKRTEIISNKWFLIILQKGTKYFKFEFRLEALYELDNSKEIDVCITEYSNYPSRNTSLIYVAVSISNFTIDHIDLKNVVLDLVDKQILTISSLTFYGKNNKKLDIDFDTESPAGFHIRVIE